MHVLLCMHVYIIKNMHDLGIREMHDLPYGIPLQYERVIGDIRPTSQKL